VLDWGLDVPGAFLWMLASGAASFAALAALERRKPPLKATLEGV